MQKLSQMMQSNIVESIEVTPEEVREFYASIPESDLHVFGTEVEIAQIVVEPQVSEEEKKRIIDQLNDFKNDVEEKGLSFASKAILYSQDPGSRSSGGKYTLHRKRPRMVKEFRDVAFSMQEGEVSSPFKTEFCWHILTVDKIKGQQVEICHILLTPNADATKLSDAKKVLDTLRKRILDKEIDFAIAAFNFSSEKETKNNGGKLVNPVTGDSRFELTKMDPELYAHIQNLQDNEVSHVLKDQDRIHPIKFKILTVTARVDEHEANFAQDYLKIKALALQEKQLNAIEKWQEEKIMDTYIKINGELRSCDFNSNWFKIN